MCAVLSCKMNTSENGTNCVEITIKSYLLKFHKLNQLSTLSWRIYSKHSPLTCIRAHKCMCHSSIAGLSYSRIAVSHRQPATLVLEQVTPQFVSPGQTAPTSTWRTTLSVASTNSMSSSFVCSKCQWTEAASVRCLVRYGTENHWQRNQRVEYESASLFAAKEGHFEQIL